MAQELVQIAFEAMPELTITAQTLPEENSSTNLLKKLGFQLAGELKHSGDGKIWEWEAEKFQKDYFILK